MSDFAPILKALRQEIAKVVVGQELLIDRLVLALISGGHVLIEGIPGLAKTLTVTSLGQCLGLDFSRIQFTPDLLPADITGSPIYHAQSGEFEVRKGPVFANLVLADEINRSPAKVQAALLEAMQEKQVSIDGQVHPLPKPFMVLATQNPIEQEGTYPLPEAQLDRFMLKVEVTYPKVEEERQVLKRMSVPGFKASCEQVLDGQNILEMRAAINEVKLSDQLEDEILKVVDASRFPQRYGLHVTDWIRYGASPRATINLALASKTMALMEGRDFVSAADLRSLYPDVLRHRIGLSYRATGKGVAVEEVIEAIVAKVTAAH
jgi:MoxR-like ATPase